MQAQMVFIGYEVQAVVRQWYMGDWQRCGNSEEFLAELIYDLENMHIGNLYTAKQVSRSLVPNVSEKGDLSSAEIKTYSTQKKRTDGYRL